MRFSSRCIFSTFTVVFIAIPAGAADRVKTANGVVEADPAQTQGVRMFKGIPFAQPPVGDLRWKPPQPVKDWQGVRPAAKFGPRCMQHPIFGDMGFRSDGLSEDCLYLNIWTPAKSASERLPVLVYFFGGGFMAGDGSEPRYDGESMARKGIVAVTVNYRLNVFGFMAHPDLTRESPHHASGNYGYLDQHAALAWVQRNIAAFGGDPAKVTIAGESAGSSSVSAQMCSPLSKGLIAGAIGESGAMMSLTQPPRSLAEAEKDGEKFASAVGAASIKELRGMSTAQIHEAAGKLTGMRFRPIVDGYFLPEPPVAILAAGRQAHVPLLAGWNSEEQNWRSILGKDEPTSQNFTKALAALFGERGGEAARLYPASTPEETLQSATDLAGDRFTGYSTWKWADLHVNTGGKPVYRYFYSRPRPAMTPENSDKVAGLAGGVISGQQAAATRVPPPRGAVHSAEIEYAMGNLSTNKVYAWTPEDFKVSKVMQEFFANFIKTGNPNGPGLPQWAALGRGAGSSIMRLDVESRAEPDTTRARYLFLEQATPKPVN